MKELTYEINKRILADIGAVPSAFEKAGLTLLKQDKPCKIQYDVGEKHHNVYAGKIDLQNSDVKGLLIDLSINNPEYIFMFRMDNFPIHAIYIEFDNLDNEPYFKVYNPDKEIWYEASVYMKAKILSEFERMVSWGFIWESYDHIYDLYDAAINLIEVK